MFNIKNSVTRLPTLFHTEQVPGNVNPSNKILKFNSVLLPFFFLSLRRFSFVFDSKNKYRKNNKTSKKCIYFLFLKMERVDDTQNWEIPAQRGYPITLSLFCRKQWVNISISTCGNLVETYPISLAAMVAAKRMNRNAHHTFHLFICKNHC